MATLVSTLATEVRNRYNLGASDPSSALIEGWVRDGYMYLLGLLPPIRKTAESVSAANTVAFAFDQIKYVARGEKLLLRDVEWSEGDNVITFHPSAVVEGDTVTIYYTFHPRVSATFASVSSDCIFGNDWLEPLVIRYAGQQAYAKEANRAASNDASGNAGWYRVLEEENAKLVKQYMAILEGWEQKMERSLANRVALGELPLRTSPLAGFVNASAIASNATGHRSRT